MLAGCRIWHWHQPHRARHDAQRAGRRPATWASSLASSAASEEAREGHRSEIQHLIYSRHVVLQQLFRPESSHIMCDDYESEERSTSSTSTLGTSTALAAGSGGSAGGSAAPRPRAAAGAWRHLRLRDRSGRRPLGGRDDRRDGAQSHATTGADGPRPATHARCASAEVMRARTVFGCSGTRRCNKCSHTQYGGQLRCIMGPDVSDHFLVRWRLGRELNLAW